MSFACLFENTESKPGHSDIWTSSITVTTQEEIEEVKNWVMTGYGAGCFVTHGEREKRLHGEMGKVIYGLRPGTYRVKATLIRQPLEPSGDATIYSDTCTYTTKP